MDIIVLDAMGVVFQSGDDLAELLTPFIIEQGGEKDTGRITETYMAASLGDISADEFWHRVSLDPALEDSYLSRHQLSKGLDDFLATTKELAIPVWLLSNDVDRWSKKLRLAFDIEHYFQGAIISGEARSRKPDPIMYQLLTERSGFKREQMIFFDDRKKNVLAATELGIRSQLFETAKGFDHLTELLRAGTL